MHKVEHIVRTVMAAVLKSPKLNAMTERARSNPYSPDELPAINIRQGAETTQVQAQTLRHYTPTFVIEFDLTVPQNKSGHHEEWLNRLRAELSELIEPDPTFGLDYVIDTIETGATEPTSIGANAEMLTQTVSYQCQYRRLRTNPNVN